MSRKQQVCVPLWLWVVFCVLLLLGSANWLSAFGAVLLLAWPWLAGKVSDR